MDGASTWGASGDLHASIDDEAFDIGGKPPQALEIEEAGLGDMPYPPDYPKQEGEPPRVQPSRMNPDNWPNGG